MISHTGLSLEIRRLNQISKGKKNSLISVMWVFLFVRFGTNRKSMHSKNVYLACLAINSELLYMEDSSEPLYIELISIL